MNYIGSLRYDPSGRKRKTKAFSKKKSTAFKASGTYKPPATPSWRETKEYPSAPIMPYSTPKEDSSWKAEASKNFTVAPAYNKGAYQVIPRKDVEHIGK